MPTFTRPLLILMPTKLYVIPNWPRDFENARSASIERVSYITLPNHFAGKRINRLKKLKNPQAMHGAFVEILQIASQCIYRGVLLDDDGPIGPRDLADKTGFPEKGFKEALEALSAPLVGLIKAYDIEPVDGKWVLPDEVLEWAVARGERRQRDDAQERARRSADARGRARPRSKAPNSADNEPAQPSAPSGSTAPHRAEPRGRANTRTAADDRSREQNRTEEVPPAVPQGGQADGAMPMICSASVAKRLVCEKILNGKNPGRLWSPDAENRLALMCEGDGLPMQELLDIAAYRAVPKSDDIPELKNRRDPITETTLMTYWGDEATRAAEFLKKYRGDSARKKEPALWREFFRWKYDPNITLPERFDQLGRTQRDEWEREHEEFDASPTAKAMGALA